MEFAWLAANGRDTALVQWKDSQKDIVWSADSTCAVWKLDQSRYAPGTGIPEDKEDWLVHMVLPSQNKDWIDDLDGGEELAVDEMAPVILAANLHVNQTRSRPDTLRIQFSEPIDWKASGVQTYGYRVRLAGHTDNIGKAEDNRALSQARAESVRQQLIAFGCQPESIRAFGYGDTMPVADNETEEGRQLNRRVEITIIP